MESPGGSRAWRLVPRLLAEDDGGGGALFCSLDSRVVLGIVLFFRILLLPVSLVKAGWHFSYPQIMF